MSDLNLANLSREQLMALVEAMKQDANKPRALTLKVSEKGALCVYGLGRFPVTLYASQWERLLSHSDAIRAFAKANASKLATKP
jgi:hypothetical protein